MRWGVRRTCGLSRMPDGIGSPVAFAVRYGLSHVVGAEQEANGAGGIRPNSGHAELPAQSAIRAPTAAVPARRSARSPHKYAWIVGGTDRAAELVAGARAVDRRATAWRREMAVTVRNRMIPSAFRRAWWPLSATGTSTLVSRRLITRDGPKLGASGMNDTASGKINLALWLRSCTFAWRQGADVNRQEDGNH